MRIPLTWSSAAVSAVSSSRIERNQTTQRDECSRTSKPHCKEDGKRRTSFRVQTDGIKFEVAGCYVMAYFWRLDCSSKNVRITEHVRIQASICHYITRKQPVWCALCLWYLKKKTSKPEGRWGGSMERHGWTLGAGEPEYRTVFGDPISLFGVY